MEGEVGVGERRRILIFLGWRGRGEGKVRKKKKNGTKIKERRE